MNAAFPGMTKSLNNISQLDSITHLEDDIDQLNDQTKKHKDRLAHLMEQIDKVMKCLNKIYEALACQSIDFTSQQEEHKHQHDNIVDILHHQFNSQDRDWKMQTRLLKEQQDHWHEFEQIKTTLTESQGQCHRFQASNEDCQQKLKPITNKTKQHLHTVKLKLHTVKIKAHGWPNKSILRKATSTNRSTMSRTYTYKN